MNLTFVFEGEEEYGSESLNAWLEANRDRLGADAVIISDTAYFEGNLPAITVGLRGIMYAQIDVELSPVDLHSGQYGGTVQNPANALATIVAALVGPDGRIRIPGFYDDVVALTDDERAAMAALPFDDETYRAEIPVDGPRGRGGLDDAGAQGLPADPRRERHVERLPGRGRQDDHPGPRPRQALDAARRRPGPGQGVRRAARLRRGDRAARACGSPRTTSTAGIPR